MKLRSAALTLVSATALLWTTGCNTAGPRGLRTGRVTYNEVVRITNNEQFLLNLVRARYRDTPLALSINSISTQYELRGSAVAGVGLTPDSGLDTYGADFGISFVEKPTISFTPLQGSDFVTQLLTPIPPSTLGLLLHSGWNADRVLRCAVQGMNGIENAPTASSPTPSTAPEFREFKRVAQAFRTLQQRSQLELGGGGDSGSLALFLHDEALGTEATKEIAELLGLAENRTSYKIVGGVLGATEDTIVIDTRSLMGVLFFVSQGVEVPPAHEEAGLVTITRNPDGSRFDWGEASGDLLRIRWSKDRPTKAAVRVKYRGVWFFIADDDLNSKSTFVMLNQLSSLLAGKVPTEAPVLTLPLG